ncbi:hypothetical protein D3C81_1323810 [compost metagenome]
MQVEKRRLKVLAQRLFDIQKTHPARSTQVFAAGGREHVAADFLHVDRHLPDTLTRVEQKQHASRTGESANLLDGLHRAAIGGDHRQRDQRDPFIVE